MVSHQESGKKRLLEVEAYTNPTLVPIGESPMAENMFYMTSQAFNLSDALISYESNMGR